MSKVEIDKLNELVEVISSVAALDFSKKVEDVKGDGSAMDTIAIGLNMLSEELEDSVVSRSLLEEKNGELEAVVLKMNEFKYALDTSSIVSETDTKGTITYVNDKFCEISKYAREELIGQNQHIVNSGHHSRAFWVNMWRVIGKGLVWNEEIKNRAKDGSIYWVNTTIIPFLDMNRKPYKYMSIRQDITVRKQVEQRILNSIIASHEKDREVFAEDLHEGIAQSLAALMLQIKMVEMKIQDIDDVDLKNSVDFIKNYINESIENTRDLATNLMPRTMMKYGIEPSLRSFISKLQLHNSRIIEFKCSIKSKIDKNIEITLYRAVVEVLEKAYNTSPFKIVVDLCSTPIFKTEINIYDSNNPSKVKPVYFKEHSKRIELHGGVMTIDNINPKKIKVLIKF